MLHLLSKGNRCEDSIKSIASAAGMFDICKAASDFVPELETALELPILPSIFGYTCLDYTLPGAVPEDHVDYEIFKKDQDQVKKLAISENMNLAEIIFEGITDYGFMHSSPFINSSLLDAISLG